MSGAFCGVLSAIFRVWPMALWLMALGGFRWLRVALFVGWPWPWLHSISREWPLIAALFQADGLGGLSVVACGSLGGVACLLPFGHF